MPLTVTKLVFVVEPYFKKFFLKCGFFNYLIFQNLSTTMLLHKFYFNNLTLTFNYICYSLYSKELNFIVTTSPHKIERSSNYQRKCSEL